MSVITDETFFSSGYHPGRCSFGTWVVLIVFNSLSWSITKLVLGLWTLQTSSRRRPRCWLLLFRGNTSAWPAGRPGPAASRVLDLTPPPSLPWCFCTTASLASALPTNAKCTPALGGGVSSVRCKHSSSFSSKAYFPQCDRSLEYVPPQHTVSVIIPLFYCLFDLNSCVCVHLFIICLPQGCGPRRAGLA